MLFYGKIHHTRDFLEDLCLRDFQPFSQQQVHWAVLEEDMENICVRKHKFPHPHLVNQSKLSSKKKDIFFWVPSCITCFSGYRELFKQPHRSSRIFSSSPLANKPWRLISSRDRICWSYMINFWQWSFFPTMFSIQAHSSHKDCCFRIAVGTVAQSGEDGSLPLSINYTMRKLLSAQL